jgi:hypothetical protein
VTRLKTMSVVVVTVVLCCCPSGRRDATLLANGRRCSGRWLAAAGAHQRMSQCQKLCIDRHVRGAADSRGETHVTGHRHGGDGLGRKEVGH